MMRRTMWYLLPVLLVLTVAGCAGKLEGDVVTFHQGPLPRGETIQVVPGDPDKQGSLEFEHYAGLIREKLGRIGYTPVGPGEPAELLAEVRYGVSEGLTEIRTYDRGYARYHFYYGRYYDPFYYGFYHSWEPEVTAYTVYDRTLSMNILRPNEDGSSTVLFEGRVQSQGREREIAKVMPYMITALFTNFPGESGVTKIVSIEKNH